MKRASPPSPPREAPHEQSRATPSRATPSRATLSRATLSRDTTPEIEAIQLAIFRRMPPWRKFQLVDEAIKTSYALAWAGLRARYPDAPTDELRRRLKGLILGEALAEKVYGPLPERATVDKS